jgi:hypothetical protein
MNISWDVFIFIYDTVYVKNQPRRMYSVMWYVSFLRTLFNAKFSKKLKQKDWNINI